MTLRSLTVAVLLAASAAWSQTIQGSVVDVSGASIPGAKVTATECGERHQPDHFHGCRGPVHDSQRSGGELESIRGTGRLCCMGERSLPRISRASRHSTSAAHAGRGDGEARRNGIAGCGGYGRLTAGVALGSERIEEAPARSRNYLNFVLAAPGVATSAGSASQRTMTGTRTPRPDAGFTIGGLRPRNNSIQIDGMDNRDETTGANRVAVGLRWCRSFAWRLRPWERNSAGPLEAC